MWPGPRPTSVPNGSLVHPAVWQQSTWAAYYTDAAKPMPINIKSGADVPLSVGAPGSPFNTMWPGPRPTYMPSFILMHPTVWPQYTNVSDREDRTDNDLIG